MKLLACPLAEYLTAEQRLGRVAPGADTSASAALLIGACFQHAFLGYFTEHPADDQSVAAALVGALTTGLLVSGDGR